MSCNLYAFDLFTNLQRHGAVGLIKRGIAEVCRSVRTERTANRARIICQIGGFQSRARFSHAKFGSLNRHGHERTGCPDVQRHRQLLPLRRSHGLRYLCRGMPLSPRWLFAVNTHDSEKADGHWIAVWFGSVIRSRSFHRHDSFGLTIALYAPGTVSHGLPLLEDPW